MQKAIFLILSAIFLLAVCGSIFTLGYFFNDHVEMSPASLIEQCELPPALEPHILKAIHDIDLGTVQVELKSKPSYIQVHEMLTEHGWYYNRKKESYHKSTGKLYVDETNRKLFIE